MNRICITSHTAWMKKISLSFIALCLISLSANAQQKIKRTNRLLSEPALGATATFTDMVSVGEQSSTPLSVRIHPNPCTTEIHISAEDLSHDKNYTYSLMNLSGQIVASGNVQSTSSNFSVPVPETLANGTYFISLKDGSLKTITTQKIIITGH